jgi:G3E family GTPase
VNTPAGLIPVTVLGGYLGAGKTTVLNHLLSGDHGRRLAVLVNDFGAVNIDADLIRAHDGDTISLENGCVCCSIADALGDALDRVLTIDPPPDHIVIEASGVADPAKVAHYGQGWPGCRLDLVAVMADAETIRSQARDQFVGELVTRQLRGADIVLLSKTDLVTPQSAATVTEWITGVVGDDRLVVPVSAGRVDPDLLLAPWPSMDETDPRPPGPDADTGAAALFDHRSVKIDRPLDRADLEASLATWPAEIVRVKGLVTLDGGTPDDQSKPGGRHLVQRVGRRRTLEPTNLSGPDRLVLISLRDQVDLDAVTDHLTNEG